MANELNIKNGIITTIISANTLNVSDNIQGTYKSPYTTKTSSYTAITTDSTIEYVSGTSTLLLYTANNNIGRQLFIKNDGTGVITVDAFGSETIDGRLTRTLAQYESLLIQSDGTSNWVILNKNTHTIQFAHEWTTGAAADATTYYIGNFMAQDPSTTAGNSRRVVVLASGWITDLSLMVSVAGTLATSEDSTLTLRNVTTSTNTTVTTTLEHNVASQLLQFNLATPLQVTKGNQLELQWLTPTWGPNPSAVRHIGQALVQ
jgi:hypothetical protein